MLAGIQRNNDSSLPDELKNEQSSGFIQQELLGWVGLAQAVRQPGKGKKGKSEVFPWNLVTNFFLTH